MSTVISTSAGEASPSCSTRSGKPSLRKIVLTFTPVVSLNDASSGSIRFGSRVV